MIDPNDPGTFDLVAACEAPLSGADRARRHRAKRKRLKETCGLKEVALLASDRQALAEGLSLLDMVADSKTTPEERRALLEKLVPGATLPETPVDRSWRGAVVMPGGPKDEYDEPCYALNLSRFELGFLWWAVDVLETARDDLDHRRSPLVRDAITNIFGRAPWWKADSLDSIGSDSAVLVQRRYDKSELNRAWKAYKDERKRTERQTDELQQLRAENARMKAALQDIAQEVAAPVVASDGAVALKQQVAALQKENAQCLAERGQAFEAVGVLQARLKKAGLVSDYRPQAGEPGWRYA